VYHVNDKHYLTRLYNVYLIGLAFDGSTFPL